MDIPISDYQDYLDYLDIKRRQEIVQKLLNSIAPYAVKREKHEQKNDENIIYCTICHAPRYKDLEECPICYYKRGGEKV